MAWRKLKTNKVLYGLCCLTFLLIGAAIYLPAACLKRIGDEYTLNMAQRGLIFATTCTAFLISSILGSWLAEKKGLRQLIIAGTSCLLAGLALWSIANNIILIFLAAAVMGIGNGTIEPLTGVLVCDIFPPSQRSFRLNVQNAFFNMGCVLGPGIIGFLFLLKLPWKLAFIVFAALSLVLLLGFIISQFPVHIKPVKASGTSGKSYHANLLILCLLMLLSVGVEIGASSWAPNYLVVVGRFSESWAAWNLTFFAVGMGIGRLLYGQFVKRYGDINPMIVSFIGCLLCFLVIAWGGSLAQYAFFILLGVFGSGLYPTIFGLTSKIIPPGHSGKFGWLVASGSLGSIIFPWMIGLIGEQANLRVAMLSISLACVAGLVVLILFKKNVVIHQENITMIIDVKSKKTG